MAVVSGILSLAFVAGLAMLFGFIANHAFKRSSAARRAGYAAAGASVLLTIPAFAALIGSGADLLPIIAVGVGTVILQHWHSRLLFLSPSASQWNRINRCSTE